MKIEEILRQGRPLLSFEFFPPKKPESEYILHETVEALSRFTPDFVSVTYGAGGSTRDSTLRWTLDIKEKYGLDVMMHLTCIASSRTDIGGPTEQRMCWTNLEGRPVRRFPGFTSKKCPGTQITWRSRAALQKS